MQLNVNGLEEQVIPMLNKSKLNLSDARDILSTIRIPEDFEYRARLVYIPQMIKDIESSTVELSNWIEDTVSKFGNVENQNEKIVNGISSAISLIDFKPIGAKMVNTNEITTNIKTTKYIGISAESIKDRLTPVSDSDIAERTGAIVKSNITVGNALDLQIQTGANLGGVFSTIGEWIGNGIKKVASAVGSFIQSAIIDPLKEVGEKVVDAIKRTAASIANVVASILKGVLKLVENLIDGVGVLATGAFVIGKFFVTGKFDTELMNKTMAFISTDFVEAGFKAFYEKTKLGQALDKYSYDIFKSDGFFGKLATDAGYVLGIVALSLATAEIPGAVAFAADGASITTVETIIKTFAPIFSGLGTTGDYAEQKFQDADELESDDRIIKKYFEGFIGGIISGIASAKAFGKQFDTLLGNLQYLTTASSQLFTSIETLITNLPEYFAEFWEDTINLIKEVFETSVENASKILLELMTGDFAELKNLVLNLVNGLLNKFDITQINKLLGIKLFDENGKINLEGLYDIAIKFVGYLQNLLPEELKIYTAQDIVQFWKDILQGKWQNAMTNLANSIVQILTGEFEATLENVKKLFNGLLPGIGDEKVFELSKKILELYNSGKLSFENIKQILTEILGDEGTLRKMLEGLFKNFVESLLGDYTMNVEIVMKLFSGDLTTEEGIEKLKQAIIERFLTGYTVNIHLVSLNNAIELLGTKVGEADQKVQQVIAWGENQDLEAIVTDITKEGIKLLIGEFECLLPFDKLEELTEITVTATNVEEAAA